MRVLLAAPKARLEAQDKQGSTPLLLAVQSGHKNLALHLVLQGADLEVRWTSLSAE